MLLKTTEFSANKKYKRVFAFGCSFTNYKWPTWADVISFEYPDVEYYNFGKAGGGNLFIFSTIMAANKKYRFTQDDLVLIMWSTFSREDRYIQRGWETPGNIFTQGYYDKEFIKKYICVKGCVVRDLALISSMQLTMDALPCDTLMLKSVNPDYDERMFDGDAFGDVLNLYRDTIDSMPSTLFEFATNGHGGWINGHHYHWPGVGNSTPEKPFSDYHPNPRMYADYLATVGIKVSPAAYQKAVDYTTELHSLKTDNEITVWFTTGFRGMQNRYYDLHLI